jgi:hypothetical protein
MFIRGTPVFLIPQRNFTPLVGSSRAYLKPLASSRRLSPTSLIFASIFNDLHEDGAVPNRGWTRNYATGQPYPLDGLSVFTSAPGPFGGLFKTAGTAELPDLTMPNLAGTVHVIANIGGGGTGPFNSVVLAGSGWSGGPDSLICSLPNSMGGDPTGHPAYVTFQVGVNGASYNIWPYGIGATTIINSWHHWAFSWGRGGRTPQAGTDYHPGFHGPGGYDFLSDGRLSKLLLMLIFEDGSQRCTLDVRITDAGQGYPVGTLPVVSGLPFAAVATTHGGAGVPYEGYCDNVVRASDLAFPSIVDLAGAEFEPGVLIEPPWEMPGFDSVRWDYSDAAHTPRQAMAFAFLPRTVGRTGSGGASLYHTGGYIDSLWIHDSDVGAAGWNDPYAVFSPYDIPIHVQVEPAQHGEVMDYVIVDGGEGYTTPPPVNFSGGHGTVTRSPIRPTAHSVISGGSVTNIVLDTPGSGFNVPPDMVLPGGTRNAVVKARLARNIKKVEFYANKRKIGEEYTYPWTFFWTRPIRTPRTEGCVPPDINFDTLEARLVAEEGSYDSCPVEITVA